MENKFIKGLFVNKPSENAKDFVIAKVSVSADTFIPFLKDNADGNGYMKFDILESKEGNYYAKLDNWKPNTANSVIEIEPTEIPISKIPF